MDYFGRFLIIFGVVIIIMGIVFWALSKSDNFLNKLPIPGILPGDIRINSGNFNCSIPLASSILLSIILTVVLNILLRIINR